MEDRTDEILDALEAVLISTIKPILVKAGMTVTDEKARNILGKVGTRITFGKEGYKKTFETKN